MQLQSKLILTRQSSAKDVESSVTLNGPDIGPKLDHRYGKGTNLTESEAPRPPFRDILFTLRDDLAASRENLVGLDNQHVENLRHFIEKRSERDDLVGGLYDQLGIIRRAIDDQFKPKNAFVLAAIEGPTSRNSDTLIKQANIAINRLKSPDLVLPAPKVKALKVDPTSLAEELETEVRQLRDKNKELRQARRAVQKSRKLKNETLEEHDQTFLWTARTLEGYYRLAGEEELAKQIRPSARRPGRRAVEITGDESGESPEQAGAGEVEALEQAASEVEASGEAAASDNPETAKPEAEAEPASQTPGS